jgi:hypothetical protein
MVSRVAPGTPALSFAAGQVSLIFAGKIGYLAVPANPSPLI